MVTLNGFGCRQSASDRSKIRYIGSDLGASLLELTLLLIILVPAVVVPAMSVVRTWQGDDIDDLLVAFEVSDTRLPLGRLTPEGLRDTINNPEGPLQQLADDLDKASQSTDATFCTRLVSGLVDEQNQDIVQEITSIKADGSACAPLDQNGLSVRAVQSRLLAWEGTKHAVIAEHPTGNFAVLGVSYE